ncbi:ATP-grasp ribosomal peptide maturase [Kitasatospora aureofaciens]|uniref:ATP-grasp ribosomal peptide maturase n=1 Tax=Kitasatospora aureofaciens TaxID=1894 RepID=UPI001C43DA08|nr:ATP-grasp ribosomal peptide maturase [Kitasatospora aureofaciens]MBV6698515.1 ATP-grasp ribosomal peptide maturase [Kitasatospora aureofaciens]
MDGHPVLVTTAYEDPTADIVITELNRRRVPVLRFDPGKDFPQRVALTAALGADGWTGALAVGDRTADLAHVRALYHRRPSAYHPESNDQAGRFAAQENRRGLGGVLADLPGCLYLSHPQAIARAECKPTQLALAARLGLLVPATLITNNTAEAKAFAAAQPAIYKPLHAGAYNVDGEPAGIWAASVEAGEITDAVSRCAHLFQTQVPKAGDVRAVVVGNRVFCALITAPPGVLDWRSEYRHLTYEPVDCPEPIRTALLAFLAELGLNFGAFDFAVTPAGEWWFLECNPNGQWAWLEHAANLPITRAIADLLENGVTE